MHRVSLQRVDRCSMRFQLETREPFLDPSVANYALSLIDGAGSRSGWLPPRQGGVCAMSSISIPTNCRRPSATARKFRSGQGPARRQPGFALEDPLRRSHFRLTICCDGQVEFDAFSIRSKEELFYLRELAQVMDVNRVPHLRARAWISFSMDRYLDRLSGYAHHSL